MIRGAFLGLLPAIPAGLMAAKVVADPAATPAYYIVDETWVYDGPDLEPWQRAYLHAIQPRIWPIP